MAPTGRYLPPLTRVALLGDEIQGTENLALRVLEASLTQNGHRVQRFALPELTEVETLACSVVSFDPQLVGISFRYQCSTLFGLATAHALRAAGYQGVLVAGGAFARLR